MRIKEILEDRNHYHKLEILAAKAWRLSQEIMSNLSHLEKIYSNNYSDWDNLLYAMDIQIKVFKELVNGLVPNFKSSYPMDSAKEAIETLSSQYSIMVIKRSKLNKQ